MYDIHWLYVSVFGGISASFWKGNSDFNFIGRADLAELLVLNLAVSETKVQTGHLRTRN